MKNSQIVNGGQFKKGFTLIELLTVIVILGILALITTPVITNLINNARKNTFKNSAYGIVQAANQYYLNSKLTGENFDEITFIVNNDKLMSETRELSFSGKSPIGSSYVKINSSGEIAINITDGTYFATKEYGEAGVLITGEEKNAITREELANKITELENLFNTKLEELNTKTEELNEMKTTIQNNKESILSNATSIKNLTNISNSENIFLKTYKIGSIYISTVNTNPSEIYGGTWERYGEGKTLIGVNEDEAEFSTANKTGGEKMHLLTIEEMPNHSHQYYVNIQHTDGVEVPNSEALKSGLQVSGRRRYVDVTNPNGGSQPHNNLQPYITVYMWKRTA